MTSHSEPMTEQRIAELRAVAEHGRHYGNPRVATTLTEALDEIERLRERLDISEQAYLARALNATRAPAAGGPLNIYGEPLLATRPAPGGSVLASSPMPEKDATWIRAYHAGVKAGIEAAALAVVDTRRLRFNGDDGERCARVIRALDPAAVAGGAVSGGERPDVSATASDQSGGGVAPLAVSGATAPDYRAECMAWRALDDEMRWGPAGPDTRPLVERLMEPTLAARTLRAANEQAERTPPRGESGVRE